MNDVSNSPSSRRHDVDGLIGQVEREAARRRADPRFPIDHDARIDAAFDAVAPGADRRRPPDPIGAVIALAVERVDAGAPRAPGGIRAAVGRSTRTRPGAMVQVRALALAVAEALQVVMSRLDALDRGRGRAPLDAPAVPSVLAPPDSVVTNALATWRSAVAADLANDGGRVLYCGPDADATVADLQAAGADAYGITDSGDPFRTDPDVRVADVVDHLAGVGTGALQSVVVAGAVAPATRSRLAAIVAELARVTISVVVVSPAPWWWREEVGTVAADLGTDRPLAAETWLEVLTDAGFVATGAFDPTGRSYRVTARRS